MKSVNIALLGLGTVGLGVLQLIQKNHEEIVRRCGCDINISKICVRDANKPRQADLSNINLVTDFREVIEDPAIDIVVELIGGVEVAKDVVMAAIAKKKAVVTANKALIALYGNALFDLARKHEVMIAYEAAVAGGIPIIKTLREGLAANRIHWVAGIVNGTSNYILSKIENEGIAFEDALAHAQAQGFAEADPSADIDGLDSAHKIAILSSLAFGMPLQFEEVSYSGIRDITPEDIRYAQDFGFRIKSLAIATHDPALGINVAVYPALIPEKHVLAHVQNEMNAVVIDADMVGSSVYIGAGAGREPTASAVVADIMDMTRAMTVAVENRVPILAFQTEGLRQLPQFPIQQIQSSQYIRMHTLDKPGVMANIANLLATHHISIEVLQQKRLAKNRVAIVLLTHRALESDVQNVLSQLTQRHTHISDVVRFRVADFLKA